jgi:Transmembrane secretion effector
MLDLRPLRSPGFRHLAAACWINEFGNWIGEIALAVLVYDRTHSPLATAVLFVSLRFLPALLAPLLTTKVETMPPRIVIGALFLVEAGLFMGIAAISTHKFSLPAVLALVGADGVCAITATALVRTALATGLTRDSLLREGNALINLGVMVAIAGAPALAGLMIASHGSVDALHIDAGTFAVAGLIILAARHLEVESDHEAGFRGRLRAGLTTLRTRPNIFRLLLAVSLVIGFASVALPIEVVFAKSTLHAGDTGYGLLLTSWGVGMLVGGLAFAVGSDMRLMPLLGVSTAMAAIGYGGMAAAPTLAIACPFSFIGGIGNSVAWVAARTTLQERIPLTRQAAVMSVLEAANQVMPALGFIAGGVVTALTSPRIAYGISAAGIAVVVAIFMIWPIDRVPVSTPHTANDAPSVDTTRVELAVGLQETEASARMSSRPLTSG